MNTIKLPKQSSLYTPKGRIDIGHARKEMGN
jgi:hypothetical protein